MAITYPHAMPSQLDFAQSDWRKTDVTQAVQSPFTGQSQVVDFGGQWREVTLTLRAKKRAEAQKWDAWLTALKGHKGTFLLGHPMRPVPLGLATGAPLVRGGGQTGGSLVIDGLGNNLSGWLLAGDLFHIGTGADTQLYEVLQDVATNGSGIATMDIWPDLRSAPADNAPLTVTAARGLFRRASNVTSWLADKDGISRRSFDAVEVVPA